MNRLFQETKCIIKVCITLFVLSTPLFAQESKSDSWNKTQAEIKVLFGSVQEMFNESQTSLSKPTGTIADPPSGPYKGRFGIRGGVGTDISGGLVFGGSLNYLLPSYSNPFEIGLVGFTGSFEETTEEFHTYVEKTDILVIGLFSNYLIHYIQHSQAIFFLVGAGLAFIEVDWEESSDTDESLGPPLPGGGSIQSDEGSTFGFIFNLGMGYKFSNNVDVRLEIPVFIITSAPGKASSVAPTLVLTLGVGFN